METVLAGEKVASFPSPVTCTLGEEVGMAGKRKTVLDKAYPKAAYTSERKRADERLQESEEHFRALIENSMDAVAVLNGDGTIGYESPSSRRIIGYKPEEIVGKSALEFLHPDDVQNARNTLHALTKKPGQAISMEVRFLHKDGSWRIIEGVARNLLHDPIANGVVANYCDITERKQMEEMQDEG